MPKVKLLALKLAQESRPTGYYEDVIKRGKIEKDYVLLSDEAYQEVCLKYAEHSKRDLMGPGSLMGAIIHKVTGTQPVNCVSCLKFRQWMNDLGWLGCWNNREVIVARLVSEAEKLGIKVEHATVAGLLVTALKTRLQSQ